MKKESHGKRQLSRKEWQLDGQQTSNEPQWNSEDSRIKSSE